MAIHLRAEAGLPGVVVSIIAPLDDLTALSIATWASRSTVCLRSVARDEIPLKEHDLRLQIEGDGSSTTFAGEFFGALQLGRQPFSSFAKDLSGRTQFAQFGIGHIVNGGLIAGPRSKPNLFGHMLNVSLDKQLPVPALPMRAALSVDHPNMTIPAVDRL
jgi:hypothetical protein